MAALARELKDKDPLVRAVAAGRLASMHDEAQAAAPTLIEMLKDVDKHTRRLAVYVLDETFAKAPVPDLLALLKDEDRDTRASVMVQLGRIGPEARDAVPALIEILGGEDAVPPGQRGLGLAASGRMARWPPPSYSRCCQDADAEDPQLRRLRAQQSRAEPDAALPVLVGR